MRHHLRSLTALAVIFLVVAMWALILPSTPPPDSKMLTAFREKRAAFDEIRDRLCKRPEIITIMKSPEWSHPPIDDRAKRDFYRLFDEIGAKGVQSVQAAKGCGFSITVWSVGLGGDGDYKGYDYRWRPFESIGLWRDNLDEVDRTNTKHEFSYRKINKDWSLYFHHWP